MRIHRITLNNYRGVEHCSVTFPHSGVTVVEGDNEVGKTSLFDAFDAIFSDLDSSRNARIRAAQPADRDVGPEAEIEVSSGEYRFVCRKRWVKQPETVLTIEAPRRETLRGREAHDRLRQIIDNTLDSHLWQALQIQQGDKLRLPSLDVPSLGAALDRTADGGRGLEGEQGAAHEALWDRISAEHSRYWTDKRRARKERTDSARKVHDAQAAVTDVVSELEAVQHEADELDRLVQQRQELSVRHLSAQQRTHELEEQWNQAEQVQDAADRADEEHQHAVRELTHARDALRHRHQLAADLEQRQTALAAIEADLERAAPGTEALRRRSNQAASARDVARSAQTATAAALKQAQADREHHRRVIDVEQFGERLERIESARTQLGEAETMLDAAHVDDNLLARIEEADLAVTRAEAAANVAAAHVTATALSAVEVKVDGVAHGLAAGQEHAFSVLDESEMDIGGAATVSVRAGLGATQAAQQVEQARRELRRLCEEGDVSDLASARDANERRKNALRMQADAREAIDQNRRDLQPEELQRMHDRNKQRITEFNESRATEPPIPADLREATRLVNDLEAESESANTEAETAETAAEAANDDLAKAQQSHAELIGRLDSAREALSHVTERLDTARQETADEALATAVAQAETVCEQAEQQAAATRSRVADADPDSVKARLENARKAEVRAQDELVANNSRQHELRGKLEARGEMGLHGRLSDAEQRLEALRRAHESVERRAAAARMLFETFDRRRSEARKRYVAPFKEQIEKLGKMVFNPTFEVELDDRLGVARRTLDGITLDTDQLSTGAQEQLGVLARLACAVIVSPDGSGAPVVIDDALGWSDPARLERMGAAVAVAGEDCQVIVLTCTPGRYAYVGNATAVKLPTSPPIEQD